ncbi:6-bladed beta-propeller [Saccharicrinis sp. FJH2]|uniref:6-bladed beta-propeller n=1 Tax=Saccharicrinis sp. FJH65 TaxID=3344659 RepID=UPI0035F26AF5
MKKIYANLLFLFILVFMLTCCKSNRAKTQEAPPEQTLSPNYTKIKPKLSTYNNTLDLDSIINHITYIPLETNKNCLIGHIHKIHSDSTDIIIHDKRNNKVLRFNTEGKFLNQIGHLGQGPDEFNEAFNTVIDARKNVVSIMDLKGRKYVFYAYDGKYLGMQKMEVICLQHEYYNNGMLLDIDRCYNPSYPELKNCCLILKEGDNIKKLVSFELQNNSYAGFPVIQKFGSKFYYNIPFQNKILEINNSKPELIYELDLEEFGWTSEDLTTFTNKDIYEKIRSNGFFNGQFVISDNILYFNMSYKNLLYHYFYSKTTGKNISGTAYINSKNKFKEYTFGFPKFLSPDNHKFISYFEPGNFIYRKNRIDTSKNISSKEVKLMKSIKAEDNPVLLVYDLKEF